MNSSRSNQYQITCPNCQSVFHTEAKNINQFGRKVRCGNCHHVWKYVPKHSAKQLPSHLEQENITFLEPDDNSDVSDASSQSTDETNNLPLKNIPSSETEKEETPDKTNQTNDTKDDLKPITSDPLLSALDEANKKANKHLADIGDPIPQKLVAKDTIKETNTGDAQKIGANQNDDSELVDQDQLAKDWEASILAESGLGENYDDDKNTVQTNNKSDEVGPQKESTNTNSNTSKTSDITNDQANQNLQQTTKSDVHKQKTIDWGDSTLQNPEISNLDLTNDPTPKTEPSDKAYKDPTKNIDKKISATDEQLEGMLDAINLTKKTSLSSDPDSPKKSQINEKQEKSEFSLLSKDKKKNKTKSKKKERLNIKKIFSKKKSQNKPQAGYLEFDDDGNNTYKHDDFLSAEDKKSIHDSNKDEEKHQTIRSILRRREDEEKQIKKEAEIKKRADYTKQIEKSTDPNLLRYGLSPGFSIMSYSALAIIIFLIVFFTFSLRNTIVYMMPEIGAIFRQYGYDVFIDLEHLEIAYADYSLVPTSSSSNKINVQTQVRNNYSENISIPNLLITIYNQQNNVSGQWILETNNKVIKPGEYVIFNSLNNKILDDANSLEVKILVDDSVIAVTGLVAAASSQR